MDCLRRNLVMRKFLLFILLLSYSIIGFSQADKKVFGKLLVIDTIITDKGYKFPDGSFQSTAGGGGSVDNADSLGGKGPAFYVDTLNDQTIEGVKIFSGSISVDDLTLSGNTISTASTDIIIDPGGGGRLLTNSIRAQSGTLFLSTSGQTLDINIGSALLQIRGANINQFAGATYNGLEFRSNTVSGSILASEDLNLQSTTNASKGTVNSLDDFDVAGNITLTGTVDGIDIGTDVPPNTTHRTSDGSDHTFIDQNVTTTGTPLYTSVTTTDSIKSTKSGSNINSGFRIVSADPCINISNSAAVGDRSNWNIHGQSNGDLEISTGTDAGASAGSPIITFSRSTGTPTLTTISGNAGLSVPSGIVVDQLDIDNNTISTTTGNIDITLTPNGTGEVVVSSGITAEGDDVATIASSTVEVRVLVDLPNTLVANTRYVLMAPITVTAGNEITIPNAGNVTIESTDRVVNTLTYTGTTGTLFTSAALSASIIFRNVKLLGNDNTTRLFNLIATGFADIQMDKCDIRNWGTVSSLSGFGGGIAIGKIGGSGNAGGVFSVINSVFLGVENCFFQNFSETNSDFFTIDALTSRVAITLTGFDTQPNERALNVNSSFTGEVIVNTVFAVDAGSLFNSAGLDGTSIFIDVTNASNQKDSETIAEGFVNANATLTSVTDGVYDSIIVTGFTSDASTERFTLLSADTAVWTYIGISPFSGIVEASVSGLKSGATANYRFAISINGTLPIFATAQFQPMEVKTSKVSVPLSIPISLVQNDTVQIMVAGDGTGDNITITDISMSIR